METRENSYEVTHPHHNPHLHQGPADVEYWRMTSGGPSKKSLDPNLIENEMSWTALHSNPPNPEYSKLISEGGSGPGYQGRRSKELFSKQLSVIIITLEYKLPKIFLSDF